MIVNRYFLPVLAAAFLASAAQADDVVEFVMPGGKQVEFQWLSDVKDPELVKAIPLTPKPRLAKPKAKAVYDVDQITVAVIEGGPEPILITGYNENDLCGTLWYASTLAEPKKQVSLGCIDDNPGVIVTKDRVEIYGIWTHATTEEASFHTRIFDGKSWKLGRKVCATYHLDRGIYSAKPCPPAQ